MTFRREIFPGVDPIPEGGIGMIGLSDQELLTRLRRAAQLYADPAVRARDPYAIKGIGQHILSYVKELRARGFEITNHGSTFVVHQRDQVEVRDGELVDEWSMKRRVYWALSDAVAYAERTGAKHRRAELVAACVWLFAQWKIVGVSRVERKIAFADEPKERQQ